MKICLFFLSILASVNIFAADAISTAGFEHISVSASLKSVAGEPDTYLVVSEISDTDTGKIIAQPKLLIKNSEPASIKISEKDGISIEVTVTANSGVAKYDLTMKKGDKFITKKSLDLSVKS